MPSVSTGSNGIVVMPRFDRAISGKVESILVLSTTSSGCSCGPTPAAEVESELGKGTNVKVYLPLAVERSALIAGDAFSSKGLWIGFDGCRIG